MVGKILPVALMLALSVLSPARGEAFSPPAGVSEVPTSAGSGTSEGLSGELPGAEGIGQGETVGGEGIGGGIGGSTGIQAEGNPVYVPEGLTPVSHFWWISCYSKGEKCCIDSACSRTVSYQEFVRAKVLPEYRNRVKVFKVEDWTYGRKIIWIRREGK